MLFSGGFTFSNFLAGVLSTVVLVADYGLQRPVSPSRHIRLGEGDLGDRSDHISLSGDLHLPDHATSRDGRAAEPAGTAGARRYHHFVGYSVADEIEKLERLKNSGTISNDEYTRLRARAVQ